MTRAVQITLRGWAAAGLLAAAFTVSASSQALAEVEPCTGGKLTPVTSIPATPKDLEVTKGECTVGSGKHYYANVHIFDGGKLRFLDEPAVEFWATNILVENTGALLAGEPPAEKSDGCTGLDSAKRLIGCQGTVTIALYGAPPDDITKATGVRCKSSNGSVDPPCGMPKEIWDSDPAIRCQGKEREHCPKSTLSGGVRDYFYRYHPLPYDEVDHDAYFGTKVLGVSYGGTLRLFGKKGATYAQLPSSSSGTSWARLVGTIATGAKSLTVDRDVDWTAGDRIVVTTTDYLPGHSEMLEITGPRKCGETDPRPRCFDFRNMDPVVASDPRCKDAAGGVCWTHNGDYYDLTKREVPGRLGLELNVTVDGQTKPGVDTRAAVALLTRSIRIVSGGNTAGAEFPAAPPPHTATPGYTWGGHTMVRAGFEDYRVQGVEFYQLGQGGRLGHYPVHYHMARRTAPDSGATRTFVKDSSIHDSMTRWITVHATQDILLERNVGYLSIGHGFYLEDGTEINNKLHSNIGILARAAVNQYNGTAQPHNPRQVPGILAASGGPGENFPYWSDADHPSVFWIMNGWNDFEHNMAAGAGTCGACYWHPAGGISTASRDQWWESYASTQATNFGGAPLKTFLGNYCSSAMNSFMTVGNTTPCLGVGQTSDPKYLAKIANPLAKGAGDRSYYPTIDGGYGLRTRCAKGMTGAVNTGPHDDEVDCSAVAKCSDTNSNTNCMVTVLDHYTSSFHWAQTNFSAVWLRPAWYVVTNSALSDVQYAGLTFVTGGDFTKSSSPTGNLMLVRKSAFIGHTQTGNAYASDAGPFVPGGLTCDTAVTTANHCLSLAEGISFTIDGFPGQRLFNIYDGPAHQDSNAYLDITRTYITGCKLGDANCQNSPYMRGKEVGIPYDASKPVTEGCFLPNAGIAWKQPNGFYYPPAFHSDNLYFHNVDIRHFVVEPMFVEGTRQQDDKKVRENYCTFTLDPFNGMFGASFTGVDRQTVLNDDDGSLTGFAETVVVNEDWFFNAPVEALECRSGAIGTALKATAKVSPYEYVSTVLYPGCPVGQTDPLRAEALCNEENWFKACSTASCAGVPLYRQYVTQAEKDAGKAPSIPMAGMAMWQRDNLTANHGKYYIDTTLSEAQQKAINPRVRDLNVFKAGQTYYVFQIFARPSTRITYQLYVGSNFKKDGASPDLWAVQTPLLGTILTFPALSSWPASWERKYGTADGLPEGILQVTMDLKEFAGKFGAAVSNNCRPNTFCKWDDHWTATANKCRCVSSDSLLLAECKKDDDAMCGWTVADVDCPDGGCYGFAMRLPSPGFVTGTPHRPAPDLFPTNETFSVALRDAGPGLAGLCAPAVVDVPRIKLDGNASGVGGSLGGGNFYVKGSFTPPPTFNLAEVRNIALNALLHETTGQKPRELVSGFGTGARPLPLDLVRTGASGAGVVFQSVKAADDKTGLSPETSITITPADGSYTFELRSIRVSIADPAGCTDDVDLFTSFGFFDLAQPIDVGLKGHWDCRIKGRLTLRQGG